MLWKNYNFVLYINFADYNLSMQFCPSHTKNWVSVFMNNSFAELYYERMFTYSSQLWLSQAWVEKKQRSSKTQESRKIEAGEKMLTDLTMSMKKWHRENSDTEQQEKEWEGNEWVEEKN